MMIFWPLDEIAPDPHVLDKPQIGNGYNHFFNYQNLGPKCLPNHQPHSLVKTHAPDAKGHSVHHPCTEGQEPAEG